MQTRKALMISVATIALSMSVTSAQAASSYVSLFGGGSFLQKPGLSGVSQTHTTTTLFFTSHQSVDTNFKTGFVVGGNWGVDWGTFRTEIELAYRLNKSSKTAHLRTSYSVNGYAFDGTTYSSTSFSGNVPADLSLSAYSLMANVWYDFHSLDLPMGITPYVGVGVGGALVKLEGSLNHIKLNQKDDFVFAWQAGAGLSVPVSDDMKLFLDYRYFAANGAQLKLSPGFHGGDVKADFDSHTVLVGLRLSL
jgi:OmpA-OmpF porin, OOP family